MYRAPVRAGRKAGFTLLEVLVALAILSTTLVLAYRVMTEAIAAQGRSEHWTTGAYLGETLVRDPAFPFPDVGETKGKVPPPNDAYTWKKTVKETPFPDAREIEVEVVWSEGESEERIVLSGVAVK